MSADFVTTHTNADLDGLASMVALRCLIGELRLVLPGGMDPETHQFYADYRAELPPIVPQTELRRMSEEGGFGTLYVVDTANVERLGSVGEWVPRFAQVLAYDSHPPMPQDLPRAPGPVGGASVSALVMELARAGKQPTPAEAGLFLLGIHQDTGHFTFASTTALDHQAAAHCALWGAPLDWPARYVPKGFTRAQLALLEEMGRRVEILEEELVQVALVALELPEYEPNLAVLLEQLREAERWPAAVAVASVGERAFCIARSRSGWDCAEAMRALGGGGHPEAASAVLHGVTLADATQVVRQTLRDFMGRHTTAGQLAARPVFSIAATASVREAADELHKRRINGMPVVRGRGAGRRFVGMVSRQDVEAALRHGYGARPVLEIASQAPRWIAADAPLSAVRQELVAGPRRLLLVGKSPHAEGVLTRGIILRATTPVPGNDGHRPPQPQVVLGLLRKHLGEFWALLQRLAQLAQGSSWPIYLVGGSVRDLFLGMPGRDLDLLVEGPAPQLARMAAAELGGNVVESDGFGTARWYPPDLPAVDFASARSEYYSAPAALPKVENASLNQDLFRRDFTANAMALALSGPRAGRLYDPYGGFNDMRAATLRVLHGLSFYDDPTRAFRAARFAARFDFALAPDTLGLLKAAVRAGVLERLSPERLGAELELILGEREVIQAFRLMRQWGLAACLLPQVKIDRAFLSRLAEALAARLRLDGLVPEIPASPDVLWLVLAESLIPAARSERARWVNGGKERRQRWLAGPERVRQVAALLEQKGRTGKGRKSSRARWAEALAELDLSETVVLYARVGSAARDFILWWLQEGKEVRSAVTGHTLRGLGYSAGPRFKQALAAALDAARCGDDAAAQLQAARAVLD